MNPILELNNKLILLRKLLKPVKSKVKQELMKKVDKLKKIIEKKPNQKLSNKILNLELQLVELKVFH